MAKTIRLSKSRLIKGIQCPKLLYLSVNEPELGDEIDSAQQMIFDQGTLVGIEAQKRFPGGVLITASHLEHELAKEQTRGAIDAGALAIFEATLEHEGVLVKIDVLKRESVRHAWEVIEVKSSTTVKEVHIQDAAIQLWVARQAGLKVKSASVMVINNQCVFPDLKNLFSINDVTNDAESFLTDFPKALAELQAVLSKAKAPKMEIGEQCDDPYSCAFKTHCWNAAKAEPPSVFDIPGLKSETKWEYFRAGKIKLSALDPDDFSEKQARMIVQTVKGVRFVDKAGISSDLKNWGYPLSFLDFETVGLAIPRYPGTRPYQSLPFQFSCHRQKAAGSKLEHSEYLHSENSDPREAISKALCKSVPSKGNVVAFNKGTEGGILKKLAEQFPAMKKQLLDMADRLVDPLPIFRAHVYDPDFNGGFSIKDVAPALLGKASSYEGMDVGDGQAAQAAYLELIAPETSAARKKLLRKGLIDYCTKDTMEMVRLVDWLIETVGVK